MTPARTSSCCVMVSPLRGAILPYVPSGHAMAISVLTYLISPGFIVHGSALNMSKPAAPSVDRVGSFA